MSYHTATATLGPTAQPSSGTLPDIWGLPGSVSLHPRNSGIFTEGDPARRIYRVLRGAVRICKLMRDGRRVIAGFYLPGEVFAVEAGDVHRFSAEAVTDTQLQTFPRQAVRARAREDGVFSEHMSAMTGSQLERAQEHMLLLGRKTAVERVASFLMDLAARSDQGDSVELPMSRLDIADFLGLTLETVSRTLNELARAGVIGLDGARRVKLLNRRRLLQLSD